ncbi:MAG: hypothetical protein JO131_04345 [Gammaproteobacteria bacterium]|nr:hypothetical protein [Gammaproteobacteria bacterium]
MLKKPVLIGTIVTTISFPLFANADLITINKTNEWSSVSVTSVNPPRCSGKAGGITNPNSTLTTTTAQVQALCSHTPCIANILMAKDQASAANCNGSSVVIGTAILNNLSTDVVLQKDINITNPNYTVVSNDSNIITISKK